MQFLGGKTSFQKKLCEISEKGEKGAVSAYRFSFCLCCRIQGSCLGAASAAVAEAKVVTGGLQEQLGSLQQDVRSLQYKVFCSLTLFPVSPMHLAPSVIVPSIHATLQH